MADDTDGAICGGICCLLIIGLYVYDYASKNWAGIIQVIPDVIYYIIVGVLVLWIIIELAPLTEPVK